MPARLEIAPRSAASSRVLFAYGRIRGGIVQQLQVVPAPPAPASPDRSTGSAEHEPR